MLTCRDLTKCAVGQGKYVLITAEDGGIVNDPVLLRVEENRWWLALADSDAGLWARGVATHAGMDVTVREPEVYPVQVQGPKSKDVMRTLFGDAVLDIKYYWTMTTELDGIPVVISRTGWTGEVGYEIYLRDPSRGGDLWDRIMEAGKPHEIRPIAPCEARRIEAGIFNYGSDMTIANNPFEVMGLERLVEPQDADYIGKAALEEIRGAGVSRKLVGIEVAGEALPFELSRKCDALHERPRRRDRHRPHLVAAAREEHRLRLGADRARRRRQRARDRRARRRHLAGPDRGDPVHRPEEDRPARLMTRASAGRSAHGSAGRRLVPARTEVRSLTARPTASSPLSADEIAAVRKPYRAASLLPGRAYHDPAIHDFERREWFRRDWVVVGREEDAGRARDVLPGRGRRRAARRGPRPRRRPAGVLQRLPPSRHGGRRGAVRHGRPLPVPVPRLDLRPRRPLIRAKHTEDLDDFSFDGVRARARSGSRPGRASCSSASTRTPRRSSAWLGDLVPHLEPVRLRRAARRPRGRLRGRRELEVHRRELQRVLPLPGHPPAAQQADPVRPRRRLRPERSVAGRLDGARRRRRDDGPRRRPPRRPTGDRRDHPVDERRIYYYLLWPLTFLSIHPDYLLVHRLEPAGADHTRIVCQWLFEPATIAAPGFDPSDAVAFWDLTNRQDWHVCELQQRGTRSRSWTAGRYSNQEPSVHAFDLMAVDRYAGDGDREPADRPRALRHPAAEARSRERQRPGRYPGGAAAPLRAAARAGRRCAQAARNPRSGVLGHEPVLVGPERAQPPGDEQRDRDDGRR